LQYCINNNEKNFSVAETVTSSLVESCSIVLDQIQAWDNARSEHKVELASEILKYVQYSAFTLGCARNNTKSNEPIERDNIAISTFTMNHKDPIDYRAKSSSILVPAGINTSETIDCKDGTAIGAVFNKLSTYLSSYLNDTDHEVNSNIVAFRYNNGTETFPLPDRLKVRIV